MASGRDLIEHFKLEARLFLDCTKQIVSSSNRLQGQRRVTVQETWERKRHIGRGNYGSVWLEVEAKSKRERAVKELPKAESESSESRVGFYQRELLAMAKFSKYQATFVHFYGWFESLETIFVTMEYFEHGDLRGHIKDGLTEDETKIITSQLLEGLKTIHENDFTHRDLKPENIFVVSKSPSWWVKIGDFGLAKRIESNASALRSFAGTQNYQAPEFWGFIDEEQSEYTNAVDMWSLGCVGYKLLTQKVPFPDLGSLRLFCIRPFHFPEDALVAKSVSVDGIQFIQTLLAPDPLKRASANEALQASWLITNREHLLRQLRQLGYDFDADTFNLDSALFWAVRNGQLMMAQQLIEEGADLAAREENLTALLVAVGQGEEEIVRILIANGAEIEARGSSRIDDETVECTALVQAASEGNESVVRLLIAEGADVNAKAAVDGISGLTSLHAAAFRGHESVLQLLIAAGADVNARTIGQGAYGETPLHVAASAGHAPALKSLIAGGADLDALVTGEGKLWTALYIAAKNGQTSAVRVLLEHSPDIEAKCTGGRTALHIATAKRHHSVVQLLLEHGCDANAKEIDGVTALHMAADLGHDDLIPPLLGNGADINVKRNSGWTPLHQAIWKKNEYATWLLIENGADIAITDPDGWTALHFAAHMGLETLISSLLRRGADATARDLEGAMPLHLAAEAGHEAAFRSLLNNEMADGGSMNGVASLFSAVARGHETVAVLLIEKGADIEAKMHYTGWTPLFYAVGNEQETMVRLLLDRGANIAARDRNQDTALHLAALRKKARVMELLLGRIETGASVLRARNKKGKAPLDMVAKERDGGALEIVRMLIDKGALVKVSPERTQTAENVSSKTSKASETPRTSTPNPEPEPSSGCVVI